MSWTELTQEALDAVYLDAGTNLAYFTGISWHHSERLAGALGGMGGSSAFGAKAGDVFTRITIITASIWILFCLFALMWAKHRGDALGRVLRRELL